MKKLFFIKKSFSLHGGAENYMKTLMDRLKKEYEITVLSHHWTPVEDMRFQKVPMSKINSFFSTTTFNRNVCRMLRDIELQCTVSFERTTCQDIYRAGEGCHAEWLEIRSKIEPLYKKLSFTINPLHRALLSLEKKLFSDTRLIIANSEMVKRQIIRHYAVPKERILVIHNGVDLERFTPGNRDKWRKDMRSALGLREEDKAILFVGSGFKRKGLSTLIGSLPLIKREGVKLLVIGKGDAKEYKALAESGRVADRIVFLQPQKEIEKLYAAADLFVLPTLYDPFSNATLEAMAAGLPVITTRGNGASEAMEEGTTGFIMNNPLDAEDLADKIMQALENLTTMGEEARKRAEGFSIDTAALAFIGGIRRVTGTGDSLS